MIFVGVTDKMTIIKTLASEGRVEAMVENIAHHSLTADLKDLCQIVYLVLLEYDEEKLQDLWENNQMNFFLARVIVNQYRSVNSPYYYTIGKYKDMSVSMGVGADISESAIDGVRRRKQ